MILHLLFDSQFTDYVIEQFSNPEMKSNFMLVSPTREMRFFHHLDDVKLVNPREESEMQNLIEDIANYKTVIFHGFFEPWQAWLLNHWPENVKIAWVCWGGEIYGQPDIRTSFLKPLSKIAYLLHTNCRKQENKIFSKQIMCKANYCLTNLVPEYEFVKNYLGTNIKHLSYNYYTIDETLGSLRDCKVSGHNIFIGNSATIENNFFEIFWQLKRVGIESRNIIVPMSYGDSWVRNIIMRVGKKLFSDRFAPLVEFMPREEYNKTMLDCAVMIQPHMREQAHGNIVTGIWLGMRVYLSEKGIDYKHFKSIGCKVYSIERDLRRSNPNVFEPMIEEDVAYNRQILLSVYGRDHIDAENRKLVKELS